MLPLTPLRAVPPRSGYKAGDVLVLFGELFTRGYANGIVEEAQRLGMKVIYSTVGRRTPEGTLRPLNADELQNALQPLINVPLEAGFDLEPASSGRSPVDQLKGIKMDQWAEATLNWDELRESQQRGGERFRSNVRQYVKELEAHIPPDANVLFVHTMAGGVPRAKIFMPTLNRIFKGRGERFEPSSKLRQSEMGRFAEENFNAVTADTFAMLIEETKALREQWENQGRRVRYLAYGYHGCEVLVKDRYEWQTYTCYFQGWAKMRLENLAVDFWRQGVRATVHNCPEILTNSSSIFQGVEVSLYPLLGALRKEGGTSKIVKDVLTAARERLKDEHSIEEVLRFTDQYLTSPTIRNCTHYENWPGENNAQQMELMLGSSDQLIEMHKDPKNLMTALLSEEVFKATGYLMLHDSWQPEHPVVWLGHDVIAKTLAQAL